VFYQNIIIVEKVGTLKPLSIKDFKIDMINSNYQIDMHIDRIKL
jgi:hypothetical protein